MIYLDKFNQDLESLYALIKSKAALQLELRRGMVLLPGPRILGKFTAYGIEDALLPTMSKYIAVMLFDGKVGLPPWLP
jgi:hypothetical protein